jgi:spermidine/putrescine transport system ATP-binding protein
MQLELKRIQEEVGITFLYVTHDQDEAMTMSDRIAVMRSGHIDQIGEPAEVYERPRTEFVAEFLGASNLLSGEVTDSDGGNATVVVQGGAALRVPADRVDGPGPVRVGVRPEKVRLERDDGVAPAGRNSVEGTLRVTAFVGVSHQYTVDGPAGATLTVYAQNTGGTDTPQPGERVRLTWDPEQTFVVRGDQRQGEERS